MVLVNHELKTPLTSMLSFTDLLAETKLDLDQKLFVSRIKTAALRLQAMINDSLEFISAETSQMRLEFKPMATPKLFGESSLSEMIQTTAANRQIKFQFTIENQSVTCDEKLIRNVFRRLLHNAAKFADHNSEINVVGHTKDNGRYELAITNRGQEIDETRIAQLLKPFTLNENIMNHTTGTGLGLSICSAMLKLHSSPLKFVSHDQQITVAFELEIDRGPIRAPSNH
jgi:signal transduction histidine kinase